MPFVSKAQQGYLFAHHPEVAKEFAAHTPKGVYSQLPQHKGDSMNFAALAKEKRKKKAALNAPAPKKGTGKAAEVAAARRAQFLKNAGRG